MAADDVIVNAVLSKKVSFDVTSSATQERTARVVATWNNVVEAFSSYFVVVSLGVTRIIFLEVYWDTCWFKELAQAM